MTSAVPRSRSARAPAIASARSKEALAAARMIRALINPHGSLAYMEMRLILAKLLWNFDLELDPGCNDWVNQKIYITWDKRPLRVLLTPRAERGGTYIDLA